jgi:site-specific recombinase
MLRFPHLCWMPVATAHGCCISGRLVTTLDHLLTALDPAAPLPARHLWLIALLAWVRGAEPLPDAAAARVGLLLDALDAQPALKRTFIQGWQVLAESVDLTALLADFGFAPHTAFFSAVAERLRHKLLPGTPETTDASELFALALPHPRDATWLAALDEPTLARLVPLLRLTLEAEPLSIWQRELLEAIVHCSGHIRATGFAAPLRQRMSASARESQPFHELAADVEAFRSAFVEASAADSTCDNDQALRRLDCATENLKLRLEACRAAAASVYPHLAEHGISVGLVFMLRQLRERVLRVRMLMDCLLSATPHTSAARLLAQLAASNQERRSLRVLVATSTSLLAAKVAERSAETGEHYITRTATEYRAMLAKAAGGGAATALTTLAKFSLAAWGFSAFWGGMWAGAMYAASFVLIQLMHWTLATKQPAMTAPAMAAKLKELEAPGAVQDFVDEVAHLVRSQVAAVLGNVGVVAPCVLLLCAGLHALTGQPLLSPDAAQKVLDSLHLLNPAVWLFAAFTGVLLFASSLIAGWAENWFVLHRLDSALRYNPRITATLGLARADRFARYMREHISGFAGNISLGFMLGLLPPVLGFVGLALDVRHVTLSMGQLAAAAASLGLDAWREPAVWWCLAAVPVIGVLNLAVSFYLAFALALRAHNVSGVDRSRLTRALWRHGREQPLRFLVPGSTTS